MVTNKTVKGGFLAIDSMERPEGHDTTIEVCNIISFVLYTQFLKQAVLKPASPGPVITLNSVESALLLILLCMSWKKVCQCNTFLKSF